MELIKLTGLYLQKSKKGTKYLQGKLSINGITNFYVKLFKKDITKEGQPYFDVMLDFEGNEGKMKRITGMWEHHSKAGNRYFQGRVGSFYLKALKNDLKRNENDPDYTLMLSVIEDKPSFEDEII